jgi:hypothetical protein
MSPRTLIEGGPIDVVTGDYLAELTILILLVQFRQLEIDDPAAELVDARHDRPCWEVSV